MISDWTEVAETFDAMGLHENLLRGIYAYGATVTPLGTMFPLSPSGPGFEKPSAIQQRGIVPFCRGYDVIQQAQSGTGKTATFCAGVLQQACSPPAGRPTLSLTRPAAGLQPDGDPGAGAGAHA